MISSASMLVLELKRAQHVGMKPLLHTRNCVRSTRDFKVCVMYLFLACTEEPGGTLRPLNKILKYKIKYALHKKC